MTSNPWPELRYEEWKETCGTLHLWTQIVGKIKLELCPFLNEWWHIGFDVSARGLATGLIPYKNGGFDLTFDFFQDELQLRTSDGGSGAITLESKSVAAFYEEASQLLAGQGIQITISTNPVELPDPIPFDQDRTHLVYDTEAVRRWWQVMLSSAKVMNQYRSDFYGKSSPVLFYWGSFDLSATRFSGRPGPNMPEMPKFFQVAEDQENAACGFWPGNPNMVGFTLGEPAYYAYNVPPPDGYSDYAVEPEAAYFHKDLGEYILPYEAIRTSKTPEKDLLSFFKSTFKAGSTLAMWGSELEKQ